MECVGKELRRQDGVYDAREATEIETREIIRRLKVQKWCEV